MKKLIVLLIAGIVMSLALPATGHALGVRNEDNTDDINPFINRDQWTATAYLFRNLSSGQIDRIRVTISGETDPGPFLAETYQGQPLQFNPNALDFYVGMPGDEYLFPYFSFNPANVVVSQQNSHFTLSADLPLALASDVVMAPAHHFPTTTKLGKRFLLSDLINIKEFNPFKGVQDTYIEWDTNPGGGLCVMSKLKWPIVLDNQHVITLIKVGESVPLNANVTIVDQSWAKACYDEDPAVSQSPSYIMRYANYAAPPGTGVPYYEVKTIPLCPKLTPDSHKPNICSVQMLQLIQNPTLRSIILGGGGEESMREQLSIPREKLEIIKEPVPLPEPRPEKEGKKDIDDRGWFQKLFKP